MRWPILLFAFYFGVLSIAPNFQGAQLLNFNRLITHYHSDTQINKLSFLDFLAEHYLNNRLPNDEQHKTLPFKTVISCGYNIVLLNPSNVLISPISLLGKIERESANFYYQDFYFLQNLSAIFHPPKKLS